MDFSLLDLPGYLPDYEMLELFNYAKEKESNIFLDHINSSPQSFGKFLDDLSDHQVEVDELNALLFGIANDEKFFDVAIQLRDWLRSHAVRYSEVVAAFNLKRPSHTD